MPNHPPTPLDEIKYPNIGSRALHSLQFYPFAFVLVSEYVDQYCWNCLRLAPVKEFDCEKCKKAKYCSNSCREDGQRDHDCECEALKDHDLDVDERMLARIVSRYSDIKHGKDKEDPKFYEGRISERKPMDLVGHSDRFRQDPAAMNKFKGIYEKVKMMLGNRYPHDEEEAFELHCRNFINRHSISDPEYTLEIGKGLYLDLCRYNHSCRPNTVYSCNGTVATLRALHDNVDLNDVANTHYSYIALSDSKPERHRLLKDTWYFDCECERCVDPDDDWLTAVFCLTCTAKGKLRVVKIHGSGSRDPLSRQVLCRSCNIPLPEGYVQSAENSMRHIQAMLDDPKVTDGKLLNKRQQIELYQKTLGSLENVLPSCNAYYCSLVASLMPLVSVLDLLEEQILCVQLEMLTKCEPFVRHCYRYAHPSKAFHLHQTGNVLFRLERPKDAARYYCEALRIMAYIMEPHFGTVQMYNDSMKNAIESAKTAKVTMERTLELYQRYVAEREHQEMLRSQIRKEKGDAKRAKNDLKKQRRKEAKQKLKDHAEANLNEQNPTIPADDQPGLSHPTGTRTQTDDEEDMPELLQDLGSNIQDLENVMSRLDTN